MASASIIKTQTANSRNNNTELMNSNQRFNKSQDQLLIYNINEKTPV